MLCESKLLDDTVRAIKVLILVLMEDALRELMKKTLIGMKPSLNPCSNGRCSARLELFVLKYQR